MNNLSTIHAFDINHVDVCHVPFLQSSKVVAKPVSSESFIANILFQRLVDIGVMKCSMQSRKLNPQICRWHMDSSHTTDRCFTFKKFLQLHKDAEWYDLSNLEEMAMGVAERYTRYNNRLNGGWNPIKASKPNENKKFSSHGYRLSRIGPPMKQVGSGEEGLSSMIQPTSEQVRNEKSILQQLEEHCGPQAEFFVQDTPLMRPERVAMGIGWFPEAAVRLLRPLVWVFSRLADGILRLLGLPTAAAGEEVTAEELRATLAAGAASGALEAGEHRLIENVLALRQRAVTSAMTPRDEIVFLDLRESPADWRDKVRRRPYSRYPVCDGGLDRVIGYARAEDVLADVLNQGVDAAAPVAGPVEGGAVKIGTLDPTRMRRDAPSVPDTLDLWEVLAQFEAQGAGFALVVSEYAVVVGLVTYKDVLAVLVGGLADPFEDRTIVRRDADSWLVDGAATVADMAHALDAPTLDADGPYETAGGFVMHRLRRVPRKADRVEAEGFVFEVVDVDGFRVNQLLVTRRPTPPPPPPPAI